MGPPTGLWKKIRESDFVVVLLSAMWLTIVLQYFIPMLVLLPLALFPGGTTLYRHIIGFYERFARQEVMCIPFSWCGMKVYINDIEALMDLKAGGNSLILANHCSRVDWMGAVFVGMSGRAQSRVGFVAEVTTGIMPLAGWSRVLFGDILLQRAFHKDGPRILNNISSFKKSGIKRLIFLAPEGTIADPGIESDEKYIVECKQFMRNFGQEPMTYLLTPRYKGMSAFVTHAPDNIGSVTLAWVEEHSRINPKTQRVEGGFLCTRALNDPLRKIPDLHSIFRGGLAIYVNFKKLPLYSPAEGQAMDDEGAKKIRDQLIEDQIRKDNDLKCFDEHRTFPGLLASENAKPGQKKEQWAEIGTEKQIQMNVILVIHTYLSTLCASYLFNMPQLDCAKWIGYILLSFFLMHGLSYKIGQSLTDGRSRESLVGETAIKAFLALLTGRDMNRGGAEKPKAE